LKKNLALTGMMGVGKSTIGKALSERLLMKFSDIDKLIENKLKMSVKKIFEKKGEIYFRKLEEKITLQEFKKENIIVSLGGGAFMNPLIRNAALSNCMCFWLDLDLKLLKKRLTGSKKRPLLVNEDLKETLEKIYKDRKITYSSADFRINCSNLNKNLIINKIIKLYENY